MRILFSGAPGNGHLLPLVPLARAFRQQGDNVAFTTSESLSALFAAEEMELLQPIRRPRLEFAGTAVEVRHVACWPSG